MRKMIRFFFLLLAFACGVLIIHEVAFAPVPESGMLPEVLTSEVPQGIESEDVAPTSTLLIGGDMMLARQVERYIRQEGYGYPFSGLTETFKAHNAVLVNFEATVPQKHVPTPSMGFSFSVAEDIVGVLASYGVTHVGLANNHAFDFGVEAYENARSVLRRSDVIPFGHPERVASDDVSIIEVGSFEIAIIPVHAVFREPDDAELEAAFAAASTSDYQVAYVHWGNEYELYHSSAQERMARTMIEYGADVIVGHHPHVVQDIAKYGDALVFYSLGNLIFDQYWNQDVREGLMLALSEKEGGLYVTLVPTRSEKKSVSELLVSDARRTFLANLSMRSDERLRDYIVEGHVPLDLPSLALDGQ